MERAGEIAPCIPRRIPLKLYSIDPPRAQHRMESESEPVLACRALFEYAEGMTAPSMWQKPDTTNGRKTIGSRTRKSRITNESRIETHPSLSIYS
jgi:hypothetical protein